MDSKQESPDAGAAKTEYLLASVIVWAVENADESDLGDLLANAIAAFAGEVNKSVLDSLADAKRAELEDARRRLVEDHFVCELAVALLEVNDLTENLAKTIAEQVATIILDSIHQEGVDLSPLVKAAIRAALSVAASKIRTFLLDPGTVHLVRFIGMVYCPDWYKHRSNGVWIWCVRPYFMKALLNAEQDWVRELNDRVVV